MKKTLLLTLSALAFIASVFTGCSHYAPEPEYKEYCLDISEKTVDSSFSVTPAELKAGGLAEGGKITFTVSSESSTSGIKIFFDNAKAEGEVPKHYDGTATWAVYNGDFYAADTSKLSTDRWDIVRNPSVVSITPDATQLKDFLANGMVVQLNDGAKVTGISIYYIGEEIIVVNVKDFSKANGKLTGKGEVVLDPDNANYSVLEIEADGEGIESAYAFTAAANMKEVTKMTIKLRTDYDLKADTVTGAVSKVSKFKPGAFISGKLLYNRYCLKPDENGHLFNMYYEAEKDLTVKDIKTNKEFNKYKAVFDVEDGDDKLVAFSDTDAEAKEDWQDHIVYTDAARTKTVDVKLDKRMQVILISSSEDGKTSYKATYYMPGDTVIPGDYADVELSIKDGFKCEEGFDFARITGYKLSTEGSEGTLYIKSITFE